MNKTFLKKNLILSAHQQHLRDEIFLSADHVKLYKLVLLIILLPYAIPGYGQDTAEQKSVLGVWNIVISVAPQQPADNRITFSGEEASGTFVDRNNHTGTWKLEGGRISWTYTSVANLKNTFAGTLSADWQTMSGTNSGSWQEKEFNGTWKATKEISTKKITQTFDQDEVKRWREDLRFLARELPARHKNLFHRLKQEDFFNAINSLDAKLPSLTRNQIALEFGRIVSMAGDGHTWLSPVFDPAANFHAFPVKLYIFKEGVFVQSAKAEYSNLVGGKVLRIGNVPIEQAIEAVSPYIPRDNEMGIKNTAPAYLVSPEVLQALHMTNNAERADFQIEKQGRIFTVELKSAGLVREIQTSAARKDWIDAGKLNTTRLPLWLKKQEERFWFEYIKDSRLLYVQINQLLNRQDKTLAQFFQEVVTFAGSAGADKLVLDLRLNGGGTDTLVPPIVRGIIHMESIDRQGHFFVITGRQTFSAAQNLVNALEKYTNAIFVGEPTASQVNMYGDAVGLMLPNSKLSFRVATQWHQDMNERDIRQWTAPQITAELTFTDYSNGIDTPMRAILEYKP